MRFEVLLTLISAVMGYALLVNHRDHGKSEATVETGEMIRRNSSARDADAIAEYQEIMLDEQQKFQSALDRANRLVELIRLAEKFEMEESEDTASLLLLIDKIARLYPQQALDYYEVCPTNGLQNAEMHDAILYRWSELNFRACIAYLRNKPALFNRDFCEQWDRLADSLFKSHPEECVEVFSGFSPELQRELIEKTYLSDALMDALLSVMKDPALVSQVKDSIAASKNKNEDRKNLSSEVDASQQREAKPHDLSPSEQWQEMWKNEWPDALVMVNAIRSLSSKKERRELLDWVTQPRRNSDGFICETPQAWLARVDAVIGKVGEVPLTEPKVSWHDDWHFRDLLADWLPQQSVALQRLWAEDVIRFQEPAKAFAWAEKLATESLRHDMRDLAWERWAATNGKDAAVAMMTKATPDEQEIHLPGAVYGWAMWDYAAAKQWLDAQPDSEAKRQALQKIEAD